MEESSSNKLIRKMEEAPFFPIGIAGFIIAVGVGAYKFKHRGTMSPSVFLMQLRVAAQGTVVGCLSLGLIYNAYRDYVKRSSMKK